jgi:acyl-CoA thioesterase
LLVIDPTTRSRLEALFRRDTLARLLGVELVDWEGGLARLRWMAGADHCNFLGGVHGGALFSLADAALAVACNSWGRVCVALSVEAQFLTTAPKETPLVADARERSRTRRTASYLIEVAPESDPAKLVASFQAMAYRTDRWHLGPGDWSAEWKAEH